ncbi:hypothetical protein BJF90_33790 [Pseudonocardia sp. CNS-004]|nr:hypothetical protein BJF90_33790 [Pseudonocardia sp. CNS-004]
MVVIDIARDGRRFAGPRAAAVVRSVADLVADQLPSGARSRFGDSDALVVTRAGWSRGDATGWMHRTLPALLDGFVAAEELPGAQLRVAVHDADGPVGAQLLQPLTDTRAPWADLTTSASEERGQKFRAARAERLEHGSRVRRTEAAEGTDQEGDAQGWPFSGDTEPADVEELLRDDLPGGGRHGSGRARTGGPARGDTGGRGRRHRADDTEDRAGDAQRRTDQTQNGATGEPQRTLAGSGRAARRRSAESAAAGSAGSGSVASGSAANGSAANGSATGGSTSNRSTSGGRSTAGRSAAQGSAAGGAEVGGSAGHGSTGNGSAGNGAAGSWPAAPGHPAAGRRTTEQRAATP